MLRILLLVSTIAAARADCDACVQNHCHSKKTVIEGFPISHRQLAIDRTSNILYVQLKYYTVAFFLDESKMLNVDASDSVGLAVDQETQVLYSGDYSCKCVYAFTHEQGVYTKKLAVYLDPSKYPFRLRYEDTLYTINDDGSCAYLNKTSNYFTGYSNLENFKVTDMVTVRNSTEWFFTSRNNLYKFSWDSKGKKTWDLISENNHVLSTGTYGDVYFGDDSIKVIYKLDREKKEMVKYAGYMKASILDFVFDRDENIVFLDYDGSVARWVPNGEACTEPHRVESHGIESTSAESHRDGWQETDVHNVDIPGRSFLVDLVQRSEAVYNNTFKSLTANSNDYYEVVKT